MASRGGLGWACRVSVRPATGAPVVLIEPKATPLGDPLLSLIEQDPKQPSCPLPIAGDGLMPLPLTATDVPAGANWEVPAPEAVPCFCLPLHLNPKAKPP